MEQDVRLARECVRACATDSLDIRQGPGEGEHFLFWYISEATATILDKQGVLWRRFMIGERDVDPKGAHPVLKHPET
jgi:hypothetical protein